MGRSILLLMICCVVTRSAFSVDSITDYNGFYSILLCRAMPLSSSKQGVFNFLIKGSANKHAIDDRASFIYFFVFQNIYKTNNIYHNTAPPTVAR